jgi:plasmid maintenance system antidote protein VapI
MAHTPEEHFKMILGLTVADLAAQLATARATIEQLQEQIATLTTPPPPEPDA